MNTERIEQALENGIVEMIRKGEAFGLPYDKRIDISEELQQAYRNIDYNKVYKKVTEELEKALAEKIVKRDGA